MKNILIITLLLAPFLLLLIPSKKQDIYLMPSPNGKPNVYVFTMTTCPYCRQFKSEFYPKLQKQFKGKVNFYDLVISDPKSMQLYSNAKAQCNISGVPLLVVGNKCINGYPTNIKNQSIQAINDTLKEKGFSTAPTPSTKNGKPIVYVRLSPTCPYCQRFSKELYPQLKRMYGNQVDFYEPSNHVAPGSKEEKFYKNRAKYCKGSLGVPLILIGNQCIVGYSENKKEEILNAMEKFISANESKRGTVKVYS